jgi:hypothetical protein
VDQRFLEKSDEVPSKEPQKDVNVSERDFICEKDAKYGSTRDAPHQF